MSTTAHRCESCGRQVVKVPTGDALDCFCDRCDDCGEARTDIFEGLCDDCAEPGEGYPAEMWEETA